MLLMKQWLKKYGLLFIAVFCLSTKHAVAENFVVTSDSPDNVPGSLLNVLFAANTSSNNLPHVVTFSRAMTISNIGAGYGFARPTIIDATTVPGYAGTPLVHLIGTSTTSSMIGFSNFANVQGFSYMLKGLELTGNQSSVAIEIVTNNVTIQNNVINSFSTAITVSPSVINLTIKGNYIGTDITGTLAKPNNNGIVVEGFSIEDRNIVIGGMNDRDRNVISGNAFAGINLSGVQAVCLSRGQGAEIIGNYIGTDVTGKKALGNLHGIYISGFSNVQIGGFGDVFRNIISGNKGTGVTISSSAISGTFTKGIVLYNNYIGTDVSGKFSLANQTGIYLGQCASDILIGSDNSGGRNIISGNEKDGIFMDGGFYYTTNGVKNTAVQGNYIGTDLTGNVSMANGRHGVFIRGVTENITIGGNANGMGNVISGNVENGICINADLQEGEQTISGFASTKGINISRNVIGLASTGNRALPNAVGVSILSGVRDILIGGEISNANTISGNTNSGVSVLRGIKGNPRDIRIYGNRIGTDITGLLAVPNKDGIYLNDVDTISIGRQYMGNTIAGNTRHGIWVQDMNNADVQIAYNKIGLSAANKILNSNGYGIIIEPAPRIFNPDGGLDNPFPGNASVPNAALSYKIGSHLANDGGNAISGHRSGGIFIFGISRISSDVTSLIIVVENNIVQHNILKGGLRPEVELESCSNFIIGGILDYSSNNIVGPLVLNNCTRGVIRRNTIGDLRGGIDLIADSRYNAIAENKVTNSITVSSTEGSDFNRITQNNIVAPGKPIILHYGTDEEGNDGIPVPVIQKYSIETGLVSGIWPGYTVNASGNKSNPLIELFSTNKEGTSALEFLGCTCVNDDGTWQTTIKTNDAHKYVFATVTGPDINEEVVVKIALFDGNQAAAAVNCPLEAQNCPIDLTRLNTSECSNVLSIACGQITLLKVSDGCVAFESTAFSLNFGNANTDLKDFNVVTDYGDGSPIQTLTHQSSVWTGYLSHQYAKKGSYTVTVDIRVNDPDHEGSTVRYACMTSPESNTVAIDNCVPCPGCLPSFSPAAGDKYIFTAWVKENAAGAITYDHITVFLDFTGSGSTITSTIVPKGDIIEGWQRMEETVTIPPGTEQIGIRIKNTSSSSVFVDDVRMHPFNASMKSFVYDPNTFRLMAELDANNYATFYEYDEEGGLVRVKKETERGVMTIKESRNNMVKISKKNP
jgi:hypothetical protein